MPSLKYSLRKDNYTIIYYSVFPFLMLLSIEPSHFLYNLTKRSSSISLYPLKGGETIDKIIAETGVKIDIDEEGNVSIYSSDQAAINRAKEIIASLVREAKVDEVYHAKVVRIEKFGAFVNLFDKTDALVHISEMAWTRTNNVEDLVQIGDFVDVKVIKIDEKGRVDASMKALLPRPPKPDKPKRDHDKHQEKGHSHKKHEEAPKAKSEE